MLKDGKAVKGCGRGKVKSEGVVDQKTIRSGKREVM
jgi:hypothetical protein